MKRKPCVSVCIPSYQSVLFIGETLNSVFSQTFQDFEIIVFDDASTDLSWEMITRYAKKDARMRIFLNEKNVGPEKNWNLCLEQARGEYIKLLCADDLLFPDCLEKQVGVFQGDSSKKVQLVCCQRDLIDAKGKKLWTAQGLGSYSGELKGGWVIQKVLQSGTNLIGEPVVGLFRAEALSSIGLFSSKIPYFIDLNYWCRLLMHGSLYFFAEPQCAFRISAQAWSTKLAYCQASQGVSFFKELKNAHPYLTRKDLFSGIFFVYCRSFARQVLYWFLLWRGRS